MNQTILERVKELPKKPGIYFFKDKSGKVLYVGKATSLRERVRSYFPVKGRGLWIEKMVHEAASVDFKVCDSATAALLLEAAEIQRLRPKYNLRLKDDKSYLYIIVKFEIGTPKFETNHKSQISNNKQASNLKSQVSNLRVFTARRAEAEECRKDKNCKVFGPFPSSWAVRKMLKTIRPIFPYRSCKTLPKKSCLFKDMGLCLAPCELANGARLANDTKKIYRGLIHFLAGDVQPVLKNLEKEMKLASKEKDFERAAMLRDRLAAVRHIGEVSGIDESRQAYSGAPKLVSTGANELAPSPKQKCLGLLGRIEAYDISHISGEHAVGSMVVFYNGLPEKSQYRRFKIKTVNGIDDYQMMAEAIGRRLKHKEWPLPDLIVIDGGKGHLKKISELFKRMKINIPLLAIAKGKSRKKLEISESTPHPIPLPQEEKENLLKKIQFEMHRFAIAYHRKRAQIGMREQFRQAKKSLTGQLKSDKIN
jgi:excinuclease ABC subunit C